MLIHNNNDNGIIPGKNEIGQNDMGRRYYKSKKEAEAHKTRKGERVYYEVGKGWYIIRPKYRTDPSGNFWPFE